jgi:hypothetical protein
MRRSFNGTGDRGGRGLEMGGDRDFKDDETTAWELITVWPAFGGVLAASFGRESQASSPEPLNANEAQ